MPRWRVVAAGGLNAPVRGQHELGDLHRLAARLALALALQAFVDREGSQLESHQVGDLATVGRHPSLGADGQPSDQLSTLPLTQRTKQVGESVRDARPTHGLR